MVTLLDKFRRYIRENKLVQPGERVLLTVSGGVDSMVMLSLFVDAGYDIGVAHCNFQLRGAESEEDEVLVENEAKRYGVPFYNRRFDTRSEMERTGESVQMAARRLRYDWFNTLCSEEGYAAIAIAHQADDSIETFFINLLRGTGLKGLTGISVVRGRVIRPLLFASRKEITDYAIANKVPYREDSSNRSTKYLRNKIRLGLIPRIREINPRFTDTMRLNISRLTDAQLFINHGIEKLRDRVIETRNGAAIVHTERIDPEFPVSFVIFELLNSAYGFKGDVIDAMCRTLDEGTSGRRFYSRDYVAWVDRQEIVVEPIATDDPCTVEVERGASKAYCGNSVLDLEWTDVDSVASYSQPENVALIDADQLSFPLTLRRWQEGDAFVPIGMEGHKKVSDFLIDAKVSVPEKQRQFVLTSQGEIVWLVGRRLDDRFKITDKTENILKITREII